MQNQVCKKKHGSVHFLELNLISVLSPHSFFFGGGMINFMIISLGTSFPRQGPFSVARHPLLCTCRHSRKSGDA